MTKPNEALKTVLEKLFEDWAMMFSDFSEPETEETNLDGLYHVEVPFEGKEIGKLELWLSSALATNLATNVLGANDEKEIGQKLVEDALRELANLSCGHFLTTYYNNKDVFNIGLPSVNQKSANETEINQKAKLSIEGFDVYGNVSIIHQKQD